MERLVVSLNALVIARLPPPLVRIAVVARRSSPPLRTTEPTLAGATTSDETIVEA